MLAVVTFGLWLLTLAAWWAHARRQRGNGPARAAPAQPPAGAGAQRAAFLRACALGDLAGCERALVGWARSERPHLHNPGALAAELDDAAQRDAIAALQRVRYAGAPAQGIASQLGSAFRTGFSWKSATARGDAGVLPELYPQR